MSPIPFFRPLIGDAEINEVVECLRSGWLTSGNRVRQFESEFREFVGAEHAVALNSCTAALHLAIAALGVQPGDGVLVPTWTFAATAEVVQYLGGVPVLVDCDPVTMHIDLEDAEEKILDAKRGKLPCGTISRIVGILPVHVGGAMCDMDAIFAFASKHGLWVVEDAAHSFPATYISREQSREFRCGETVSSAICFSFYANKTITTGEGGMLVSNSESIAESVRQLSLHGLSSGAWKRFSDNSKWDYQIVKAGFKYNLTDIAASIGIHQLRKAEQLRQDREKLAKLYLRLFEGNQQIDLPPEQAHGIHAWHLFPIRIKLETTRITRNEFCEKLTEFGIGFSVHWRPLHLHPLYADDWSWTDDSFPNANSLWPRVVSLPLYAGMTETMVAQVVDSVGEILESAKS